MLASPPSPALCLSSPPLLLASRLCMRSCKTNAGCAPLPPAASRRGPKLPAQRRLQVHWDRTRIGRKKCAQKKRRAPFRYSQPRRAVARRTAAADWPRAAQQHCRALPQMACGAVFVRSTRLPSKLSARHASSPCKPTPGAREAPCAPLYALRPPARRAP